MVKRALVVLFSLGALCACGGDEEPSCQGSSCAGDIGAAASPDAGAVGPGTVSSTANDSGAASVTPSVDASGSQSGNNNNKPPSGGGAADAAVAQDAGAKDTGLPSVGSDASAPVPSGEAKPSAGCGMAAPTAGKTTIDVDGMARTYIMALPKNYDPTKPYRLIFAFHGLTGTADQIANGGYYGQLSRSQNSAIFVAGQGLDTNALNVTAPGWDNMGGRDVAFVKALYARLQSTLCIDENRVFSLGMSYGGIMSNTLGCEMGDVFRAIAPMSGSGPGYNGRATCKGEVAVWMSHGDMDTTVKTASGMASRDFWVKANKCQQTSKPVDPSPCVAYDGCAPDLPVTFCLFSGGHTIPPFAYDAIWKFFSQF